MPRRGSCEHTLPSAPGDAMKHLIVTLAFLLPAHAVAQPATQATQATQDDGYCDFVQGQADATAAPLYAPQVFGQFGYIEQPTGAVTPVDDLNNLRVLGGIRWSLSNIYTGSVTKSRASAECRRHNAIVSLRGITAGRAAAARVKIYEEHMAEASRLFQHVGAELAARRVTLQDANAMRMRVDNLRSALADAKRELATLPPQNDRPLAGLLAEYRSADADVEKSEGKLRTAQAYDLSVRFGVDRFIEGANTDTRYFGVVQVGLNLGLLFTGSGNARAAKGRARYSRSGNDPAVRTISATADQLRALIDVDTERATQAKALVADLGAQMEMLQKMATDDALRLRQTLWFDWVRAKADLAYLTANVAAMQEIIGQYAQAQAR